MQPQILPGWRLVVGAQGKWNERMNERPETGEQENQVYLSLLWLHPWHSQTVQRLVACMTGLTALPSLLFPLLLPSRERKSRPWEPVPVEGGLGIGQATCP